MLTIKQISVDIKTNGYIPTNDYIGVDIDAIAKVRIKTDPEGIALAQKNFLNMREEQIVTALTDSLQGNMREIIGTVKLQDLCTNRKAFGDQVQEKAQNDMAALGIEIISCNIQKIKDEKDLIVALGQDNMSQIQKSASIAKAQAERDVQIADAAAKKEANAARVAAETEIAQRITNLEIKKAELKVQTDTAKAEADAAYEIQKQQQEKRIQTETVNAQIAKAERESELKEKEISVRQRQLEAEVNKQADAEKYATEQRAAADLIRRQREAEATRYAAEQEAAGIRAKYEAEANGIALKGKAEAEAAKARGLAEAEAMEKKAEAYNKYNRAAMVEMIIKVLPEIAGKVAEPLKQIDKITIVGGGADSNGLSSVADNVPLMMKKTFESVKEATGIDLAEIVRAESYDAKVNKNVNISGVSEILDAMKKEPENENKDTKEVEDKIIDDLRHTYVQGLTILGGEPFLNTQVAISLVKRVREEFGYEKDIWVYSGYTYEQLLNGSEDKKELLSLCDVLVDGPFMIFLKDLSLRFRGSSNQRIIDLKKSTRENVVLYLE